MGTWISYASQSTPGNQSFQLGFHSSLAEAKGSYEGYCDAVGTNDCHMTLYYTHKAHEGRMIETAKEFEGIGCPFDYPDKIIERGPRGGIKVSNT